MKLLEELSAQIDRAETLLARIPPRSGIAYLLVRKSIAEARAAIDAGDEERMRFYLAILTRMKDPGMVSRETGKPPGPGPR